MPGLPAHRDVARRGPVSAAMREAIRHLDGRWCLPRLLRMLRASCLLVRPGEVSPGTSSRGCL